MPNTTIRAVRESKRLTQAEFAAAIRRAGDEIKAPNDCSVKTVQRWETGATAYPRLNYVRALERVTGLAIEDLGFNYPERRGEIVGAAQLDPDVRRTALAPRQLTPIRPTLTGVWESRCTYESSSRGTQQVDRAYLILVDAGDEITAYSLAGTVTDGGTVSLKLSVKGRVVTGTWEQVTGPTSYYRGQTFHGALQLQLEASGARMVGAWVGFGRDFDVNTGPWELIQREHGTDKAKDYAAVPVE